jgi:hypothetical protein
MEGAVVVLAQAPVYDRALAEWILGRRARLGHDRAFYGCAAWRRLRARVLAEYHGESQWELGLAPARVVPATVVHHVMHVEDWPGWALSEWALDESGEVVRNLVPLSQEGHDAAHQRFGHRVNVHPPPLTEERW